jgi:hypothetical protein
LETGAKARLGCTQIPFPEGGILVKRKQKLESLSGFEFLLAKVLTEILDSGFRI